MIFEEAEQHLSHGQIELVAQEMRRWHPVTLAQMLLAVQAAKEVRYLSPHPDYHNAIRALSARNQEPRQGIARLRESDAKFQIIVAIRELKKK